MLITLFALLLAARLNHAVEGEFDPQAINVLGDGISKEFKIADSNHDGRLTFEEAERYTRFRGKNTPTEKLQEIFDKADMNKDKALSLGEVAIVYIANAAEITVKGRNPNVGQGKLDAQAIAALGGAIRKEFRIADKDDDGGVTFEEAEWYTRLRNNKTPRKKLLEMFMEADLNENAELNVVEVALAYMAFIVNKTLQGHKKASQQRHILRLSTAIRREFPIADQNGDDQLSYEEVQRYADFVGKRQNIPIERLKELFGKADLNKDNALNIVEVALFYIQNAKEKHEREGSDEE